MYFCYQSDLDLTQPTPNEGYSATCRIGEIWQVQGDFSKVTIEIMFCLEGGMVLPMGSQWGLREVSKT